MLYRINHDDSDLEKAMQILDDTMNTFQSNTEDKLYCSSTGCAASNEVESDFTSLEEKDIMLY